jgi:hypothetical protein
MHISLITLCVELHVCITELIAHIPFRSLQALINVWCQNIGKNIGLAETKFSQ